MATRKTNTRGGGGRGRGNKRQAGGSGDGPSPVPDTDDSRGFAPVRTRTGYESVHFDAKEYPAHVPLDRPSKMWHAFVVPMDMLRPVAQGFCDARLDTDDRRLAWAASVFIIELMKRKLHTDAVEGRAHCYIEALMRDLHGVQPVQPGAEFDVSKLRDDTRANVFNQRNCVGFRLWWTTSDREQQQQAAEAAAANQLAPLPAVGGGGGGDDPAHLEAALLNMLFEHQACAGIISQHVMRLKQIRLIGDKAEQERQLRELVNCPVESNAAASAMDEDEPGGGGGIDLIDDEAEVEEAAATPKQKAAQAASRAAALKMQAARKQATVELQDGNDDAMVTPEQIEQRTLEIMQRASSNKAERAAAEKRLIDAQCLMARLASPSAAEAMQVRRANTITEVRQYHQSVLTLDDYYRSVATPLGTRSVQPESAQVAREEYTKDALLKQFLPHALLSVEASMQTAQACGAAEPQCDAWRYGDHTTPHLPFPLLTWDMTRSGFSIEALMQVKLPWTFNELEYRLSRWAYWQKLQAQATRKEDRERAARAAAAAAQVIANGGGGVPANGGSAFHNVFDQMSTAVPQKFLDLSRRTDGVLAERARQRRENASRGGAAAAPARRDADDSVDALVDGVNKLTCASAFFKHVDDVVHSTGLAEPLIENDHAARQLVLETQTEALRAQNKPLVVAIAECVEKLPVRMMDPTEFDVPAHLLNPRDAKLWTPEAEEFFRQREFTLLSLLLATQSAAQVELILAQPSGNNAPLHDALGEYLRERDEGVEPGAGVLFAALFTRTESGEWSDASMRDCIRRRLDSTVQGLMQPALREFACTQTLDAAHIESTAPIHAVAQSGPAQGKSQAIESNARRVLKQSTRTNSHSSKLAMTSTQFTHSNVVINHDESPAYLRDQSSRPGDNATNDARELAKEALSGQSISHARLVRNEQTGRQEMEMVKKTISTREMFLINMMRMAIGYQDTALMDRMFHFMVQREKGCYTRALDALESKDPMVRNTAAKQIAVDMLEHAMGSLIIIMSDANALPEIDTSVYDLVYKRGADAIRQFTNELDDKNRKAAMGASIAAVYTVQKAVGRLFCSEASPLIKWSADLASVEEIRPLHRGEFYMQVSPHLFCEPPQALGAASHVFEQTFPRGRYSALLSLAADMAGFDAAYYESAYRRYNVPLPDVRCVLAEHAGGEALELHRELKRARERLYEHHCKFPHANRKSEPDRAEQSALVERIAELERRIDVLTEPHLPLMLRESNDLYARAAHFAHTNHANPQMREVLLRTGDTLRYPSFVRIDGSLPSVASRLTNIVKRDFDVQEPQVRTYLDFLMNTNIDYPEFKPYTSNTENPRMPGADDLEMYTSTADDPRHPGCRVRWNNAPLVQVVKDAEDPRLQYCLVPVHALMMRREHLHYVFLTAWETKDTQLVRTTLPQAPRGHASLRTPHVVQPRHGIEEPLLQHHSLSVDERMAVSGPYDPLRSHVSAHSTLMGDAMHNRDPLTPVLELIKRRDDSGGVYDDVVLRMFARHLFNACVIKRELVAGNADDKLRFVQRVETHPMRPGAFDRRVAIIHREYERIQTALSAQPLDLGAETDGNLAYRELLNNPLRTHLPYPFNFMVGDRAGAFYHRAVLEAARNVSSQLDSQTLLSLNDMCVRYKLLPERYRTSDRPVAFSEFLSLEQPDTSNSASIDPLTDYALNMVRLMCVRDKRKPGLSTYVMYAAVKLHDNERGRHAMYAASANDTWVANVPTSMDKTFDDEQPQQMQQQQRHARAPRQDRSMRPPLPRQQQQQQPAHNSSSSASGLAPSSGAAGASAARSPGAGNAHAAAAAATRQQQHDNDSDSSMQGASARALINSAKRVKSRTSSTTTTPTAAAAATTRPTLIEMLSRSAPQLRSPQSSRSQPEPLPMEASSDYGNTTTLAQGSDEYFENDDGGYDAGDAEDTYADDVMPDAGAPVDFGSESMAQPMLPLADDDDHSDIGYTF